MIQPKSKTAKMRNCILTLLLAIVFPLTSEGQCPNSSFTLPSGICLGAPYTLINTGDPGMTYSWDLNTGDINNYPTGTNLGNFTLSMPQQNKIIIENGNRYLFIPNYYLGAFTRLDFGNSFLNTPTFYDYGNFASVLNGSFALDIVSDNGNWYALIANYLNNSLYRIDLGNDLSLNNATITALGSQFNLNYPKTMKIMKENGNFYAFISNESGNNIVRIDFGTSISNNTPTSVSLPVSGLASGTGIDIAYDCTQNKYIGYISQVSQALIRVLDFGTSLTNIPVSIGTFNTAGLPTGLQLVRDGSDWYLMVTSYGINSFQNFKIGPDLSNLQPSVVFQDPIASIGSPTYISVVNDSSIFYAFVSNSLPSNSLSRIQWPGTFNNSPAVSSDPDSVEVVSSNGGTQLIMLSTTNSDGLTNYYVDSLFVNPSPVSNFYAGTACNTYPVLFSDSSTISSGSINTWMWNFGDGSPNEYSQNPGHSFSGTGTYTVELTTTSDSGCTQTYSTQVVVYDNPIADFSFTDNQCQFSEVAFADQSQPGSGTIITSWNWDFGDSTPVTGGQNQLHPFSNTGSYQVQLVTTTDVGCSDTLSKNITIIPSPAASFSVSSTCVNDSAVFINSTSISGGGSIGYNWDFGDGNSSIQMDPIHYYTPVAANYDVELIATASNGCKDTIIQNIRIANKPVAQFNFTPTVVCQGNAVWFSNTSTGTGSDTISAYLWDFGDLITSTDLNPDHIYADTGYYNVTLTVTSPTACDSSVTQQLYVIPGPTATFNATQVCLTQSTSFSPAIITPPGTTIDSIVWDFGDSLFFSGITSPTHTYSAPGNYTVNMTVYNNLLCTYTYSDTVTVYPLPAADFLHSLACSGTPVTFDGSISQVIGDSITSWLWDFNGLGNSTDTFPQFMFINSGIYDITLIVSTSHGCSDTMQNQVNIIHSPDFYYTYNEPCLGANASFNYYSNVIPEPPANLLWNFGDGSLSTSLSPTHLFTTTGSFQISLTITDPGTGCVTTRDSTIIVNPIPIPGFTSLDICEDLPRTFTDTSFISSGTITNWNWDFGIMGSSTLQNPVITPQNPGSYFVKLTAISDKGCAVQMADSITVYARPAASFTTDPLFGSPPFEPNFINSTSGAIQYLWDFGDGSSGTGTSPVHIFSDTGTYHITLIAVSDQGCTDTISQSVLVLYPYLDLAVMNVYSNKQGTQTRLIAELANLGNINITSAKLRGLLQNESVIMEEWTGNLAPGTVIIYEFISSYDNSNNNNVNYACVEAIMVNDTIDENLQNNMKCSSLVSQFEILSINPSPFTDHINLQFNLPKQNYYEIDIFDIQGKVIINQAKTIGKSGYNFIEIPTHQLSKGMYILQLISEDNSRVAKIVKK